MPLLNAAALAGPRGEQSWPGPAPAPWAEPPNLADGTLWFDAHHIAAPAGSLGAARIAQHIEGLGTGLPALWRVAFRGGEPFTNPTLLEMLAAALERQLHALVVTRATHAMRHRAEALQALRMVHGDRLLLRVMVDAEPARPVLADAADAAADTLFGLHWLAAHRFHVEVAGQARPGHEAAARRHYARLFANHGIALDAMDPAALSLAVDAPPIG